MASSKFDDTLDVFATQNFKENSIDAKRTMIFTPKDGLYNAQSLIFESGTLANIVPDSVRYIAQMSFTAPDGSDLVSGRYQLENALAVYQRLNVQFNREDADNIRYPAKILSKNMLVNKSEREIELDGDNIAFHPHTSTVATAIVRNSTIIKPAYVDTDREFPYSRTDAGTIASAGGLAVVGTNTVFVAGMIGGIIVVANVGYQITAVSSATGLTATGFPIVAGGTAYDIYYKDTSLLYNSQFARGSELGVSSSINASGKFWVDIPLKHVSGFLANPKMIPFGEIGLLLEKETNWAPAIYKQGVGAVDAIVTVHNAMLVIDVINPKLPVANAIMDKFRSGTKYTRRVKKQACHYVDQTSSNANVDLQLSGKRIEDLWVFPQEASQYANQTVNSMLSGAIGNWSQLALFCGQIQFPRFRSFRGITDGNLLEFADLRDSCDQMDSEGGCFLTKQRWLDLYRYLYINLSERSADEKLSPDLLVRLDMTWLASANRRSWIFYTYEEEYVYNVLDNRIEKVSSYVL